MPGDNPSVQPPTSTDDTAAETLCVHSYQMPQTLIIHKLMPYIPVTSVELEVATQRGFILNKVLFYTRTR